MAEIGYFGYGVDRSDRDSCCPDCQCEDCGCHPDDFCCNNPNDPCCNGGDCDDPPPPPPDPPDEEETDEETEDEQDGEEEDGQEDEDEEDEEPPDDGEEEEPDPPDPPRYGYECIDGKCVRAPFGQYYNDPTCDGNCESEAEDIYWNCGFGNGICYACSGDGECYPLDNAYINTIFAIDPDRYANTTFYSTPNCNDVCSPKYICEDGICVGLPQIIDIPANTVVYNNRQCNGDCVTAAYTIEVSWFGENEYRDLDTALRHTHPLEGEVRLGYGCGGGNTKYVKWISGDDVSLGGSEVYYILDETATWEVRCGWFGPANEGVDRSLGAGVNTKIYRGTEVIFDSTVTIYNMQNGCAINGYKLYEKI